MGSMSVLFRWVLALIPLGLTPVLGLLVAEGHLNFGGGEKDLVLLIPWLLWSLSYCVFQLLFWQRRLPLGRGLSYALFGATGVIALAYLVALIWFSEIIGIQRG